MESKAKIAGHPIHQILIVFPARIIRDGDRLRHHVFDDGQ